MRRGRDGGAHGYVEMKGIVMGPGGLVPDEAGGESRYHSFPEESVGRILSTDVLTASPEDRLRDVFRSIYTRSWDDIQCAFVLDKGGRLLGVVDLSRFSKAELRTPVVEVMARPGVTVDPLADQERVVLLAIKHDVTVVPVVDGQGVFHGAVTAGTIIDVMHQEHLEDALLASGLTGRGSHILKLARSRYREVIASRAPWLVFGAVVGLALGFIASRFEHTLRETVALAYFIPVITYIADSVGTQAEAITVRALATLNIRSGPYLLRELIVGICLGAILGLLGGAGALAVSGSLGIAAVVASSLLIASALASVLASLIPITFRALGKDPALGSGPLATALQDVLSVVIYFVIAMLFL